MVQNFAPGFKVERRATGRDSDRYIKLSIVPQHPGSGHTRTPVILDGYIMACAEPSIGYLEAKKKDQIQNTQYLNDSKI